MTKKRLRVLALMDERLVPPEDPGDADLAMVDWKTEYDVVTTIEGLGHEVRSLGVLSDLAAIRTAIDEYAPDIVFNLLEDFHDVPIYDQNVVSYLELLRVPYTGSNSRGLMLARDKAISKALLASARIPVPEFFVARVGRSIRRPKKLSFPLIVKSLTKEGSAGIAYSSVVDSDEKLEDRVRFVHRRVGTDAIVERYIDGRELYVGILGNYRLQVLPVWELHFTNFPADAPRIATAKAKWDPAFQEKRGIRTDAATDLPDGVMNRVVHLCKRAYRTLHINGYARIDLRLDGEGRPYVLEVNPNPQMAFGEDFAESAEKAGLSFDALIQRILKLGLAWLPELPGSA